MAKPEMDRCPSCLRSVAYCRCGMLLNVLADALKEERVVSECLTEQVLADADLRSDLAAALARAEQAEAERDGCSADEEHAYELLSLAVKREAAHRAENSRLRAALGHNEDVAACAEFHELRQAS